jgi:hypothetical protein
MFSGTNPYRERVNAAIGGGEGSIAWTLKVVLTPVRNHFRLSLGSV